MFSIEGKVAVITGAGGVLGGSIARSFAKEGAIVVGMDIRRENLDVTVNDIKAAGGRAYGYIGNVLSMAEMKRVAGEIAAEFGHVDILINAAGGNVPGGTIGPDQDLFGMTEEGWKMVNDLNLNGTVFPCFAFGEVMTKQGKGSMITISSMATYSAITRVLGYSVAKSGINIFTKWMASEIALRYGEGVRINAIAPGFFIGDQNRALLLNPDGSYTERSHKVMNKTPMKRFGDITELNGAVQFLCSDAASFITGAVLPIDGGFSAFSGV